LHQITTTYAELVYRPNTD